MMDDIEDDDSEGLDPMWFSPEGWEDGDADYSEDELPTGVEEVSDEE